MLMDKLLRKENLDLRLTPYKVLATGVDHGNYIRLTDFGMINNDCIFCAGMVQYIPSLPLASILAEYGNSLTAYLREHNQDSGSAATGTLPSQVMDTYLRSCGM
jgi:phosphatidylinositol 3-kinase